MAVRGLPRAVRAVLATAALLAGSTSCSSGGASSDAPTSAGCVDATGRAEVSRGPLSMGPFAADALTLTSTHRVKVWVGTRRPAQGAARLTVVGPDGETDHYARPPGATVPHLAGFYPGLIAVTRPGDWTIRVRVGTDRICARVRFS